MNRAKLTFGAEGSLIQFPAIAETAKAKEAREAYFKGHYGLQPVRGELAAAQRESFAAGGQEAQDTGRAQATGEDLYTPKPEDLIRKDFRALTETIVAGGTWRATDFTKPGVLKNAVGKFIGKPAYQDHLQYGTSFVGVIETARYTPKRSVGGQTIPGGVDIVYLINAKQNERLAGGLLMTPPAIYSNSVTIEFLWEPSHKFETEEDFFRNIGKMGADNKMVTRVATEVVDIYESSILWMGADPWAKMLGTDGVPINPDYGSTYDEATKYTKEMWEKEHHYYASFSYKKEGITLTADYQFDDNKNGNKKAMKELEKLIREALGLNENDAIPDNAHEQLAVVKKEAYTQLETDAKAVTGLAKIDSLNGALADPAVKTELEKATKSVEDLTKERDTFKQDKEKAEADVKKLEPLAKAGEAHIQHKREETERLYKLTLKQDVQPSEAIIKLIKEADDVTLDGLLAQYTGGVTDKFTATCKKCQSNEFEFRSSIANPGGEGGEGNASADQYRQNFKDQF